MQFRHPELLFALFLLLIPILVHLFQLRKFKEERFTNVAFLQKLKIQTRKSNSIKRWLILTMRLLALLCIILAFAQPFFTNTDKATREKETIIYLDNSFSMQAKGPSGQLLKVASQDLIKQIPEDQKITIITNSKTYRNTTIKNVRNELLKVPYSPNQFSETALTLKAQKEFTNSPETDKRLVFISDFQEKGTLSNFTTEGIEKSYVQLRPAIENNVSIDSIFISERKARSFELTVMLSTLQPKEINTAVSLYNGATLLAKGTVSFDKNLQTSITFDIDTKEIIEGRVLIDDPLLSFDNTLYFSINKEEPIKVLVINGANASYLQRIFTAPEFQYTVTDERNLDYSSIPQANFIVVNELETLSDPLVVALNAFAKAGGIISIVLNSKGNKEAYNKALQQLGNFSITKTLDSKRLVTTINYDHPIYKDVFDSRIDNFQYPSITKSFNVQGGDAILRFEDGGAFITAHNGVYITTGSIDTENANFKSSPLIVPTLYNMSKQSLELSQLYFYTGQDITYDIPIALQEDDILTLQEVTNSNNTSIPLQRSQGNKVQITTTQEPSIAGIYNVNSKEETIGQVSYNYPRDESILRYATLDTKDGSNYESSINALFEGFNTADAVTNLWKWFVIFALLFLLLEILILKFYK